MAKRGKGRRDKLVMVLSYIHNPHACYEKGHEEARSIYPTILQIEYSGFYKKNIENIEKLLDRDPKPDIIQIVFSAPVNLMQLKKILRYSYSTIHEHVHALEKLRIIRLVKGKSKKGKKEMRIALNENVKIILLSKKECKVRKIFEQELEDSEKSRKQFEKWIKNKIEEVARKPTEKRSTR